MSKISCDAAQVFKNSGSDSFNKKAFPMFWTKNQLDINLGKGSRLHK